MAMISQSAKNSCLQRMFVRYFSSVGQRFSGYVNYYHSDENFGFVVRDDQPEKEYHFTGADLHVDSVPKVRTYSRVEFATLETGYGRCLARDVSAPMGRTLSFRHANLRLPEEQRKLNLSDIAAGGQRFTGVVIHISEDGRRGYIIPDKLQYQVVQFDVKDLWVTGQKRIPLHAEVEFIAMPRDGKMDKAYHITRPGGGLITSEHKYLGGVRRVLGAQYTKQDKTAVIPNHLNRQSGYVCAINEEKLYCMITPHDNMFTKLFCHFDDLHIFGNRRPRLYDPVEFSEEEFPDRKYAKAIHVTGPSGSVIQSVFDNELIGNEQRTRDVLVTDEWQDGYIDSVLQKPGNPQDFYGFITPTEVGTKRVYFHKFALVVTDSIRCFPGSRVQFKVATQKDGNLQAMEVTGYGGVPLTFNRGPMGDFYRGHATSFRASVPAPLPQGRLQGFVFNYSPQNRAGQLEISSLGVRCQRVQFYLDDVKGKPTVIPQGSFVEFDIEETEVEGPFQRRARNITSVGSQGFDPQISFNPEGSSKDELEA